MLFENSQAREDKGVDVKITRTITQGETCQLGIKHVCGIHAASSFYYFQRREVPPKSDLFAVDVSRIVILVGFYNRRVIILRWILATLITSSLHCCRIYIMRKYSEI